MTELLDFVLHAHGGLERWHEVQNLDVRLSLKGGLYLRPPSGPRLSAKTAVLIQIADVKVR